MNTQREISRRPLRNPLNPGDLMDVHSRDRVGYLSLFFPELRARELARMRHSDIRAVLDFPDMIRPELPNLTPDERMRLRAFCRLVELYAPTASSPPAATLLATADVWSHFRARAADLRESTTWVVCLDGEFRVDEEVLAVVGGTPDSPPPLKTLLRHVLIRPHARFIVVDFRPFNVPAVDEATTLAFERLRELGGMAGARITDWVVLGFHGAVSVSDQLASTGPIEFPAKAA